MVRILLVADVSPWPTDNGGRQRTNLLVRALSRFAHVDLFLLPKGLSGHSPDLIEHLKDEFNLVATVAATGHGGRWKASVARSLRPVLRHLYAGQVGGLKVDYAPHPATAKSLARCLSSTRYDLVVGRYLLPTARAGALDHQPLIIDVDDLDSSRCRTQLALPENPRWVRWLLRRRLENLERQEPAALSRAQHLWVCSESDRRMLGSERATVLPNIPFQAEGQQRPPPCPPDADRHRILFVGSLDYVVNERGLDRFLERAWPTIRAQAPTSQLRIVGSGLSSSQRSRWSRKPGVVPAGFASDLRREYASAAFSVVPLFEGGGTKIKVVESLAMGCACVTTRHALRGFEHILKHDESLWVADDDQTLAQGCLTLLGDHARRDRLVKQGRHLVNTHFTFEAFERIVGTTLERVLDANPEGVRPRPAAG